MVQIETARRPRRARMVPDDPGVQILGVRMNLIDYSTLCERVLEWKANDECHYCCFVNPHTTVMSRRDPEMRTALNGSKLSMPDGVGMILAARLMGLSHRGRVTGPSSMLRLIEFGIPHGLRHYFYGGEEGVAEELIGQLKQRYPDMAVAGSQCPPFRSLTDDELDDSIREINGTAPDVVWVALGSVRQEKWMHRHYRHIQAHAIMGVGAAFNFHSGRVRWAPAWIRSLGLEWAYRLVQEPRVWHRNVDNVVFLTELIQERFRRPKPR